MNCNPFVLLPNGTYRSVRIMSIKGKKLFAKVKGMSQKTAEQVEMFANATISDGAAVR